MDNPAAAVLDGFLLLSALVVCGAVMIERRDRPPVPVRPPATGVRVRASAGRLLTWGPARKFAGRGMEAAYPSPPAGVTRRSLQALGRIYERGRHEG